MIAQQILEQALEFHQAGRLTEAEALYRQVLSQHPDHPDALHLLGLVCHERGNSAAAEELIRRAIARRPTAAEFHSNLGLVLEALGRLDESARAYTTALRLKPDLAQAHYGLGIWLQRSLKTDQAVAAYEQALHFNPDLAEAHNNLATLLAAKGQLLPAISHYERADALRPNDPDILSNFGIALRDAGQLDRSVDVLRRALGLRPDLVEALMNLGTALTDQGLVNEALDCYRKALALAPDRPGFHSNLIATMNFEPRCTQQDIRNECRRWWQRHGVPRAASIRPHDNLPDPQRRLRIGYISSDFWNHASALFFAPLFSNHDREAFEVFCYSNVPQPDAITERLRGYASVWRDIFKMPETNIVELIRADRIDILVDAKLHSSGNSLPILARKPAPVQVTWLGYPGTTGVETIDYRITDPYLDPTGQNDEFYSEESVRLPNCFWCYDPLSAQPPVGSVSYSQIGRITFGNLNNFFKFNEQIVSLWSQILAALPESRMLLLAPPGTHRERLLAQLAVPAERIEFVPRQPRERYLRFYDRIDLVLDTFPYNGHTTNFDALWMGVPVLTLVGQRAFSRAGLSLLSNLGLAELIAHDSEHYIKLAVQLANNPQRLIQLRGASLRRRMEQSPLMDGRRFARDFEAAYRTMWQRWCGKQSA